MDETGETGTTVKMVWMEGTEKKGTKEIREKKVTRGGKETKEYLAETD